MDRAPLDFSASVGAGYGGAIVIMYESQPPGPESPPMR